VIRAELLLLVALRGLLNMKILINRRRAASVTIAVAVMENNSGLDTGAATPFKRA